MARKKNKQAQKDKKAEKAPGPQGAAAADETPATPTGSPRPKKKG
jgi:hypothetical protein